MDYIVIQHMKHLSTGYFSCLTDSEQGMVFHKDNKNEI